MKVKCIKPDTGLSYGKFYDVDVIKKNFIYDRLFYTIEKDDDGFEREYFADRFEVVNEPKFKIGDRVRIVVNSYYKNQLGTIYTIHVNHCFNFSILLDGNLDSGLVCFDADELELVSEPEIVPDYLSKMKEIYEHAVKMQDNEKISLYTDILWSVFDVNVKWNTTTQTIHEFIYEESKVMDMDKFDQLIIQELKDSYILLEELAIKESDIISSMSHDMMKSSGHGTLNTLRQQIHYHLRCHDEYAKDMGALKHVIEYYGGTVRDLAV